MFRQQVTDKRRTEPGLSFIQDAQTPFPGFADQHTFQLTQLIAICRMRNKERDKYPFLHSDLVAVKPGLEAFQVNQDSIHCQ
jgi:hypothetical protein